MRPNPRLADHLLGSPIRTAQEEFNRTYCGLLHLLDQTFNGNPKMLGVATGTMYALKAQAQSPDGNARRSWQDGRPDFRVRRTGAPPMSAPGRRRIVVLENGPYVVSRARFDGTESAEVRPYEELQHVHDGVGISARRVGELCIHAAFCIGRTRPIAKMLDDTADSDIRSNVMGRIDHCPSGSYSYALSRDGDSIEPDLPEAISVLEEENGQASALWVTGDIPVVRADGQPLQTRNRMTICRCGHSANKPLCDGTHRKIAFRDENTGGDRAE